MAESEKVDDSFFNGAVFVGDSISLKMRNYVKEMRKKYPDLLGNAKFLTTGSLSSYELLQKVSSDSLHPVVQGKRMTLENALAKLKAKKLYIMLGMNDVSHTGVKKAADNLVMLLLNVRAKLPDIEIYVQSATPRLSGVKPTTEMLFEYDIELYRRLSSLLLTKVYFVDVGYIMRDDRGYLPKSYCSDPDGMAMHFTNTACRKWVEFLYTHTAPQAEPGAAVGEDA